MISFLFLDVNLTFTVAVADMLFSATPTAHPNPIYSKKFNYSIEVYIICIEKIQKLSAKR